MYAVETIICSGLFYALYRLLLEGRIAHRTARVYLVLSVLFAVVVPMLRLPILPPVAESLVSVEMESVEIDTESIALPTTAGSSIDWWQIALWLYIAVSAVFLVRFFVGLITVARLHRGSTIEEYKDYELAVNSSISKPFSFWKTIFIGADHYGCDHIILHEQSHIRHRHTVEKLTVEIVRIVMWFNPFIHLVSNSISQVQEWEADSDVLRQGVDIVEYKQTIFHQLFGYIPDITCGLNNNLTKKRFIMMTKFKAGRYHWVRLLAVIPIAVAMIFTFGAVAAKAEPTRVETSDAKSVVEIRKDGEEILLNDQPVTLEELGEAVKQTVDQVITISAENDVPMGTIADVKSVLRENGVTRVNYSKADGATADSNPIVTVSNNSNVESEEVAEVKETLCESGVAKLNYSKPQTESETTTRTIKARNILIVDITTDGRIVVHDKEINEQQLKKVVKRFIHNFRIITLNTRALRITSIKDGRQTDDYSEFTTTGVNMGEGVRMAVPVSKGIVSIKSELAKDSPVVESVSNAVYEAFIELREKMAHRIYGKSYDKLDETQKTEIKKVVPINIALAEKK